MNNHVPDAFVFMKVGPQGRVGAQGSESLEEIFERKKREIERECKIFWGHGGKALVPRYVQCFAKEQGSIHVLMACVKKTAKPQSSSIPRAKEYSTDKKGWKSIPSGIQTGGRYALVLGEIEKFCVPSLNLGEFEVGIGTKRGKNAAEYVRGQNDKGCLVRSSSESYQGNVQPSIVSIGFRAELLEPYAVFLQ